MPAFIRLIHALNGLAGLGALILGLLHWTAIIHLVDYHRYLGMTVAATLLIVSIALLFITNMRRWAVVGTVYAPIVFIFGMTQMFFLIGSLHWLIQAAHLLVGIGALGLCDTLCNRYLRSQIPEKAASTS